MKEIIRLDNIKRDFHVGDETVHALRGVSFTIREGEFVTIMGTSGSGKSTLLNTLGCLDTPTSGEYYLDGVSVRTMNKRQRATLRNRKIGFVFQNYNLLPKTTAVENVELPLMYNPTYKAAQRREKAVNALIAVGLGDRLMHKSNQMSGGQMQRVAIARALVNDPAVELELLYIDDLLEEMISALKGEEHRCMFDGVDTILEPEGRYCAAPVTHKVTLGEIVRLLEEFKSQPATLVVPEIPQGSFAKKLYSTFLSYLPKEKVSFPLKMNVDHTVFA